VKNDIDAGGCLFHSLKISDVALKELHLFGAIVRRHEIKRFALGPALD